MASPRGEPVGPQNAASGAPQPAQKEMFSSMRSPRAGGFAQQNSFAGVGQNSPGNPNLLKQRSKEMSNQSRPPASQMRDQLNSPSMNNMVNKLNRSQSSQVPSPRASPRF